VQNIAVEQAAEYFHEHEILSASYLMRKFKMTREGGKQVLRGVYRKVKCSELDPSGLWLRVKEKTRTFKKITIGSAYLICGPP
jgi:hypothetical protein